MAKITFSDMSPEELIEEMAETFSVAQLRSALAQALMWLAETHATQKPIHIWCDGGCRYNGQPHAEGYYSFQIHWGSKHKTGCSRLPLPADLPQTNNVAEYYALLQALVCLREHLGNAVKRTVLVHTDSALVHGQMCLHWKRNVAHISELWGACIEVRDALQKHHAIEIVKEPRTAVEAVLGH